MLFDVDFTFFLKSLPEIFSAPTVIYRVYDHFLWVDPELKEDLLMPDLIHILASFSSAHLVRPSPDKSEIKKKQDWKCYSDLRQDRDSNSKIKTLLST